MLRVRFKANPDDPRPVNWPVKHPWWCTGFTADTSHSIIVSYADNLEYILRNWPEAEDINSEKVTEYTFTNRFPKPDWFKEEKNLWPPKPLP